MIKIKSFHFLRYENDEIEKKITIVIMLLFSLSRSQAPSFLNTCTDEYTSEYLMEFGLNLYGTLFAWDSDTPAHSQLK